MGDLVATLPDQLRWAADLTPPDQPHAQEALVAGMGGSGVAGDIARVVAEAQGARVSVTKTYGLPGWAPRAAPLLVAVSHSGNTEETLSVATAAAEAGLASCAVTRGGALGGLAADWGWPVVTLPPGEQPRAAVGHIAGGVLRMLEGAGLLAPQAAALREAADVVEGLLGGVGQALADDLADALSGRAAIIYGGEGIGAVAAQRWKTQLNENANAPAWTGALPEIDHNEIVGWDAWPRVAQNALGVVFLHDPGDHPRIALRAQLTAELLEGRATIAGEAHAQGVGPLARLFSLIALGDLMSVAVAEIAGIDAMAVDAIDELKRRLKDERP